MGSRRPVRILLLADTHIGFDDPARPRVVRRRRGPDFLRCFERALEPALHGDADLVVHGGDLLYRARVPASLVQRALAPLLRVAEAGVPVFLVPGNHERSRLPFPLLARHPNLHVFRRPGTFTGDVRGVCVAVSGFPFAREVGAEAFRALVEATAWRAHPADLRLLCLHQAVEGAVVGVQDFVFRRGRDVVPGRALPRGFAAVLAGHIHRSQVLTHDLQRRPLAAPVLYPGSIERTSFAERDEVKGTLLLECSPGRDGGRLDRWTFDRLPTRPMRQVSLDVRGLGRTHLAAALRSRFATLDPQSIVRLELDGEPARDAEALLTAPALRRLAPPSMNVDLARPAWREALRAAR